jgi:hypothetical protein
VGARRSLTAREGGGAGVGWRPEVEAWGWGEK